LDHVRAAHLIVLLCFAHCCRGCRAVETETAKAYFVWEASAKGVFSMRVHLDRKPLDGMALDGMAIAFVVITLLTVVVLAILLSRLNAFF
jgi:hypothetical protein